MSSHRLRTRGGRARASRVLCLLLLASVAAAVSARSGAAGEAVAEPTGPPVAGEVEPAPETEEGGCGEGGDEGASDDPSAAEGDPEVGCEPAPAEEEEAEEEEPPSGEDPPQEPAQPPAEVVVAVGAAGAPAPADGDASRGVVRGAPIRAPREGRGSGSRGRRGHGGRRDRGAPHSGGTAAGEPGAARGDGGTAAQPPPSRWHWAGAWSIPWPIVACESGGDYGALNPASGAGGAYQIIPSTWRAYGGSGSPQTAPAAEQDRIAARIWADVGAAAWECAWGGRYLGAGLAGALGPLPDPLPPARRLDAAYVALAIAVARVERIDWGLLLALVRVRGGRGAAPAGAAELRRLARRLAALGPGPNLLVARRLLGRRSAALRAVAVAHYNHAVGRLGLSRGLVAVGDRLERRVLASRRLRIYPGGREDVRAGRVDVRVLTLLLYLGRRFQPVSVGSLISGHDFFTAGGRPSKHPFGQAVDVTELRGMPLLGNQRPGGLAERALRAILLMPRELQAEELISLFDLGGPSFAASDHADHFHIGF